MRVSCPTRAPACSFRTGICPSRIQSTPTKLASHKPSVVVTHAAASFPRTVDDDGSGMSKTSVVSTPARTALVTHAAASFPGSVDDDGGLSPLDMMVLERGKVAKFFATIRALLFYLTTFATAMPMFVVMLAIYPFVMLFDKYRRGGEHVINTLWSKLTTLLYFPVKIHGLENLPDKSEPVVYVSNHESFLDIYTLFHVNRDFKFISKTSNFFIPIIGWSMFLTGHVMINRVDRKSQIACLKECGNLLLNGASVLFFPEGTRSKDGKMHGFKKGAFSVAAKAKVPVVPITLKGAGSLMPNKKEYLLYPGKVEVVIHPRVAPSDADTMMREAFEKVASSLDADKVAADARAEMK